MVTPLVGPPNNGIDYAAGKERWKKREEGNGGHIPFRFKMVADKEMGILAEVLRRHPAAHRSFHPILSFTGVYADFALDRQTIYDPLAPIGALAEKNGWALLMGVDHTVNTSIHYAEKMAGRRQFVRWALTRKRIVECPGFPGDSAGFQEIARYLDNDVFSVIIGEARVQAIPLNRLFERVSLLLKEDPLALLCQRDDCARCNAVRNG
jgi:aminoglycoside 3-N-acetyltransferase